MADVVPFGSRQPFPRTKRPASGKPKPKPIEAAPAPPEPDPADPRRLNAEKRHGGQLPPIEPEVVKPDPNALRPALDMEMLPLRSGLAITRRAIQGQWVTGVSEEEMATLNRTIYNKAIEAAERGDDQIAHSAAKTLTAVKMAECREGELMDKLNRLDAGKPTSITETATPEQLERIAKIVAAGRAKEIVSTVTATGEPAAESDSPLAEIIQRAKEGQTKP